MSDLKASLEAFTLKELKSVCAEMEIPHAYSKAKLIKALETSLKDEDKKESFFELLADLKSEKATEQQKLDIRQKEIDNQLKIKEIEAQMIADRIKADLEIEKGKREVELEKNRREADTKSKELSSISS